jgi:hypothetical protein
MDVVDDLYYGEDTAGAYAAESEDDATAPDAAAADGGVTADE